MPALPVYRAIREMSGVNFNFIPPGVPWTWDNAARAGRTLRIDGNWQAVEPTGGGVYNWTYLDQCISEAVARGMRVTLIVGYGNTNYGMAATPYGVDMPATDPDPNPQLTAWYNWIDALIVRYGSRVAFWELWNEPQRAWTADRYAALATKTATRIKASHPEARVLFGGGLPWNVEEDAWAQGNYKNAFTLDLINRPGALAKVHAVSLHLYRQYDPEALLLSFDQLTNQAALTVPVVATEWGYAVQKLLPIENPASLAGPFSTPSTPIPGVYRVGDGNAGGPSDDATRQRNQAAHGVRLYLVTASLGFSYVGWFNFVDTGLGTEAGYGLWDNSGNERDVAHALLAMQWLIGEYVWQETLETGPRWAMRFRRPADGHEIVARWVQRVVDVGLYTEPVPPGGEVYDWDGSRLYGGAVPLIRNPRYFALTPIPDRAAPTWTWTAPTAATVGTPKDIRFATTTAGNLPGVRSLSVVSAPAGSALTTAGLSMVPINGGMDGLALRFTPDAEGYYVLRGTITDEGGDVVSADVTAYTSGALGLPTIEPRSGRVVMVTFPAAVEDKIVSVGDAIRATEARVCYISGLVPDTDYDVDISFAVGGHAYALRMPVTTAPDSAELTPCALGDTPLIVWSPNRMPNEQAGLNDAAWIPTGAFAGLVEEHTTEHHVLMGGMAADKSCTVYTDDTTAGHLMVGDLLVDPNGKTWSVVGIPVQPMAGGHWEIDCEWLSQSPVEVQPWI